MVKEIIIKRLTALRALMKERNIAYYLIPTGDYHGSEYVSEYFKAREFMSGFTGSNGTLLVEKEKACLWTDGRYFIQAEKELEGTGIFLQKMGEKDVPTIGDYLKNCVKEGETIAFDGKVVTAAFGRKLEEALKAVKPNISYEEDLVDLLWEDRPAFVQKEILIPREEIFGKSTRCKLSDVKEKMKEQGTSALVLSKLDDIMWLFNIRGLDIACNPVAFSYAILTEDKTYLFIGDVRNEVLLKKADNDGVILKTYKEFYPCLRALDLGDKIWLCENSSPYAVYKHFPLESLYLSENPTGLMKARKNETEIENLRKFYLLDSVAVTKFIYRMKQLQKEIAKGKMVTEYEAACLIDDMRKEIEGYLDKSFDTIAAYGENAAMMHYEADKESCATLKNSGMLLVDSGGQYLGATTDVTRTIAMGEVTEDMKLHFTKVAEGMLHLTDAKFLYGCTGRNLDILARRPLWELGIDYKCGTGHGVGYMLNVHEGPQNIRYRYIDGAKEALLEEGMLVTNEPGVYKEGAYGIRTENVLLVRTEKETEDGQFLCFETLTYVPIDLELIEPKYLDKKTVKMLNEYHKTVYEKVSPYLCEDERVWLEENTKNIDDFY